MMNSVFKIFLVFFMCLSTIVIANNTLKDDIQSITQQIFQIAKINNIDIYTLYDSLQINLHENNSSCSIKCGNKSSSKTCQNKNCYCFCSRNDLPICHCL